MRMRLTFLGTLLVALYRLPPLPYFEPSLFIEFPVQNVANSRTIQY